MIAKFIRWLWPSIGGPEHAIDRWIERADPTASREQARAAVYAAMGTPGRMTESGAIAHDAGRVTVLARDGVPQTVLVRRKGQRL